MSSPLILHASRALAIEAAEDLARANGAPVAVVHGSTTGWYQVVGEAEDYESMIESGRYVSIVLVEPSTTF